MDFKLRDIIDLEFFLALDDKEGAGNDARLWERDREIYQQIKNPGLSDTPLLREWLSYRKLLFFHSEQPAELLPGTLFATLLGWASQILFAGGTLLGVTGAYSFLAYHGSRPINVTIFIFFFILLQALIALASLTVMAVRRIIGSGRAPLQPLVSGFFFRKFSQLWQRACDLPGGRALSSVEDTGALLKKVHQTHDRVLFWPFFRLTSLFAMGFCCGALGATLFRVAVTDLAFGWQSTLAASGAQVHRIVAWMALPWSWALPQALPGPEQIEGSRIILKEGLAGLATRDLTAWWPFLSMGILVYGVLLRLVVVVLAGAGQAAALSRLDTSSPRYRRLLVRMRSPRMETQVAEKQVVADEHRPAVPRPDPNPRGYKARPSRREKNATEHTVSDIRPIVLASGLAYPREARRAVITLVETQMGIAVRESLDITFDFEADRDAVSEAAARIGRAPFIILHEVWQPPIRGLLYYLTRLRNDIFPKNPLWIVLTRTPGNGPLGVDADEINYRVWEKAVSHLNDPGIVLERILP